MTLLALLAMLATCPPETQIYPLSTEVVSVDYETDTVTCCDFNGNGWAFYGCEDWMEGDICALLMCNNATSEIYDDYILDARYCGYIREPDSAPIVFEESEVIFR